MEHSVTIAPKNLVICCDGTGNEISQNISNVLKQKTRPRQMVSGDTGAPTVFFAGSDVAPRSKTVDAPR